MSHGHQKMENDASVGYTHHQTYGYDQHQQPQQQQQIMMQQPTHVVQFNTDVVYETWSWCTLVTSIISICCCQLFGLIATVTSLMSYTDHRTKDYEGYRSKKSCALGFAIAGIVIGCIILIVVIAVVATTVASAEKVVEDSYNNNYFGNNN